MNNLIKILLYSLLALLVVAISVMIYRRTQPEATVAETVADASDSLFLDPSFVANGPLTKEDSMILDLTGDLATKVAKPEGAGTDGVIELDYSKPVNSSPSAGTGSTIPKAQTVSQPANVDNIVSLPKSDRSSSNVGTTSAHHATVDKSTSTVKAKESKSVVTRSAPVTTKNSSAVKTKEAKSSSTNTKASTGAGTFYVVAGSYIVPSGADAQVKKLKKMGFSKAIKKAFGNEEYYRAVAGQYTTHQEASSVVSRLKAKGIDAFIKK
ncbi:MAG TPA: SPOR domain-containing protein [Saprospiraceae bacterium]|nr:SPOR domain-containing protein [Saprospiraceae bacterium]